MRIVPEETLPLRVAKTRTRFREHVLRRVHACHKVWGNLVLFKCRVCKNRLVVFHPKHEPEMALDVVAAYPNKVHEWDQTPPEERSKAATFHKGVCQRCADSLKKVEADDSLRGIATFSSQNMMDLLWGIPDVDDPRCTDDVALRKELRACFDQATVVEEMLVALLHMQVDVCYMRQGRRRQYNGLPAFRKNIIAFPQELSEVKQLLHFWTSVEVGDLVNVHPAAGSSPGSLVLRARVLALQPKGFDVALPDGSQEFVEYARVRQRVRLPWKPQDLHDNFIVLRRRNARREEYVEDLRVRRNLLRRILKLLTTERDWRKGHGVEPLHMYYVDFDIRSEHELEDIFPMDDVPSALHFRDLDESDYVTELTRNVFQDWLTEGRHNCDVAQALLHTWTHYLQGSANDTLHDFFEQLLEEYVATVAIDAPPGAGLPVKFLAAFVKEHCSLATPLEGKSDADKINEIVELVVEEVALVEAYTTAWRGTGTVQAPPPQNVEATLRAEAAKAVLPWPSIGETPVRESTDGRIVKAHPLTFPTGCGDLRQPRLRTDFTPLDWTQHVFRYFDGRVVSSLRGQRAVWACFNSAMRVLADKSGSLLHKQTGAQALSKAAFRDLVTTREDLVTKLGTFGSSLPSTAMQWKREGNELEWIVRQMSWKAPWTDRGQAAFRKEVRNRSAYIHPSRPGGADCDGSRTGTAAPDAAMPAPAPETFDPESAVPVDDVQAIGGHVNVPDAFSVSESSDADQHAGSDVSDYDDSCEPLCDENGELAAEDARAAPAGVSFQWRPWHELPDVCVADRFGYGRSPAFWFTLNFAYNHAYDLHRFHSAVEAAAERDGKTSWVPQPGSNTSQARDYRCTWVANNADLVAFVHALRVEMQVRYVMADIVPCNEKDPFLYWLRFEWGTNGNPHAHGQSYVAGNPTFEDVVDTEETRQELMANGYADAHRLVTREKAEGALGDFFDNYVSERHPAKNDKGDALYIFVHDILRDASLAQPQCTDLLELLDEVFQDGVAPDLAPLQSLLVALIEDGQRHTWHGDRAPTYGSDPCARKGSSSQGCTHVYCRYLFPRLLRLFDALQKAVVEDDPHRPNLRNLFLARNDPFLNQFEEHLLLCNLGNIDWRALLNLWAVLEYLTKYTAKAGKGSSPFKKTFADVAQAIDDFEKDDGLKDLWRSAIMKFYSRVLGGRDYSLLETVHFGLRLPATLSSFGNVRPVSISDWSVVKRGDAMRHTRPGDRATFRNKREIFDLRGELERPKHVPETHLHNLSMYAFWRLYDVAKKKLVRKQREQFVALSGTGWAKHARFDHPQHEEYAKRTLLAYMPCPGLAGTEYIVDYVKNGHHNNWPVALRTFVMDPRNRWCPTWIVRNYEVQSDVIHGFSHLCLPPMPVQASTAAPSGDDGASGAFPHADQFSLRWNITKSGEPAEEHYDAEQNPYVVADDRWSNAARPSWQRHSALGPNVHPEGKLLHFSPLEAVVNPADFDYTVNEYHVSPDEARTAWAALADTDNEYADATLHRAALGDDFQQLFVDIVLRHVETLIAASAPESDTPVKPLRLMLLGTAGTGKTTTVQTTLQEIRRILDHHCLPAKFVRVAAPTGCAAFNLRFNATTVHRLIHHFNIRTFSELDQDRAAALQAALAATRIIFFDEVSMIGRQFMGRIDSRLTQAKAGQNPLDASLGGTSSVCVGDPAQCEAIWDQQLYDCAPHTDTSTRADAQHVSLSNRGLTVYGEFDKAVVLSNVHRLQTVGDADTPEKIAYNARCVTFSQIMHRLRDMTLTHADYFWLCKLKRSARSTQDRLFFQDAPVLMEFRRTTEANEEENCEHYNRQRVRALAKETGVPVIAFDATHEGTTHDTGLRMDANMFSSLPSRFESCAGAPVLLTHNLAVEHGLMNGSQGKVVDTVYAAGCHPNHDCVANRMPMAFVVDFPGYSGPPFFSEPSRRTWVILLPHTVRHKQQREVTRTQFPLCLAWALTPWKAQGMTLAKVIVKLGSACSTPGVLFVALTRVRHPDNLLLEDDFPAFSVIRRQLAHPSFAMRQRWERRMRVVFSRTIRQHMRDEDWFNDAVRWTQADSDLADTLVEFWRKSRDVAADDAVAAFCSAHAAAELDAVRRVWGRMQQYPHCFELAAARGELASLNMDGTPCDGPAPVASVGRFSFFGWKVDVADVEDYLADGALSESLLQALLLLLRDRWPQNAYVFGPHLVRTRKVSLTLPQRRGGTCPKESSLPEISCFPYRTVKSKHWVLYVRVEVGTAPAKLVLFKRDTVPAAALATSNEYMESFFNLSLEERALPSVAFTDLAVLLACAEAMTDVPFETVQATAAKTVDATASFCKTLLTESAATRCADLLELTASAPTLGDFVRAQFLRRRVA